MQLKTELRVHRDSLLGDRCREEKRIGAADWVSLCTNGQEIVRIYLISGIHMIV